MPNTDIVCKLTHNIVFTNVFRVNVTGLTILLYNYEHDRESALFVDSSTDITISKMIFLGSGDETMPLARAIESTHSNITIMDSQFKRNTGYEGGAVHASYQSNLTLVRNIFTGNRAISSGGAISINDLYPSMTSSIIMINTTFINNAAIDGGAVYCGSCVLALQGNNTFMNNYCQAKPNEDSSEGGAIYILSGNLDITDRAYFSHNQAQHGGAIYILTGNLDITDRAYFSHNRAQQGGAIYILVSRVQATTEILSFKNNSEGALAIYRSRNIILGNVLLNSNIDHLRSPVYMASSIAVFTGNTTILNNTGRLGGAIQMVDESSVIIEGYTVIDSNSATAGGAIYAVTGKITLHINVRVRFINNRADEDGGALYASGTNITFDIGSTVEFKFNSARSGGAMYLRDKTTLSLGWKNTLVISKNNATDYGGGIYHEDSATPTQCTISDDATESNRDLLPYCFLTIDYAPNLKFFISNSSYNTVGKDGSALYGGLLDKCRLIASNVLAQFPYDFLVQKNIPMENNVSAVSSKPYKLCFCDNDMNFDCTGMRKRVVHRGQNTNVSLIALGQGNTSVSTFVRAVVSNTAKLDLQQNFQFLPQSCSNFTYTVYSTSEHEELVLYSDGPCHETGLASAVIHVTLKPCPDAFSLHNEQCGCEERLLGLANCTVGEEPYITIDGSTLWINGTYTENGSYQGLILFDSCPKQNCKTEAVRVSLDDPDVQCALNHSGVLCGACAANHSLMLGSSRCKKCSNAYLALLILFVLIGIALTVFLIFIRLTVATGMINSVILYANIVQVNRKLFFPANQVNILTVFIAWMNLDLGFETCFFHGLDEYIQTWLQLTFPLYVWILIAVIILISRYSITMTKLTGSNPIAVLATLLLMSYTKTLKIIVDVYSSVDLDYPNGRKVTVWLKDANVPYLRSKHLLLTVVSTLILVLIFLPYTLLLLLGYKIYRFSGRKYFRWLRRLKPLLESYYAPYKVHTRYWTGFLLLVRCALYIVFSFNTLGGERKSLLAIIIAFTGIIIVAWLSVKIYKKFIVNIIEASTYLNLIILSAATLADVNTPALVYTLVGVMFATMVGIVIYHFHICYTAKSALWQKIEAKVTLCLQKKPKEAAVNDPIVNTGASSTKIVTKTHIELREPILEN